MPWTLTLTLFSYIHQQGPGPQALQNGDSEVTPQDSACPPEGNSPYGTAQTSRLKKPAWPPRPPQFHRPLSTLMHSLTHSEPLSPINHTGRWPQSQKIRPAIPLGCNPKLSFCLQASVPRGLVSNPSIWGTPEPKNRTPPVLQKETLIFGAV